MRRLRREQRGATVLEFALVLPVFLAFAGLVLFGAWLGVVKTILDHGAREGARFAAVPSSPDLRTYPSDGEVAVRVNDATPMLDPSRVRVVPGAGGNTRYAPFKVQLDYQVTNPFRILFAPLRIFGWDGPAGTLTVTAEAEARRE